MEKKLTKVGEIINAYNRNIKRIERNYDVSTKTAKYDDEIDKASDKIAQAEFEMNKSKLHAEKLKEELANIDTAEMRKSEVIKLISEYKTKIAEAQEEFDKIEATKKQEEENKKIKEDDKKAYVATLSNRENKEKKEKEIIEVENQTKKELTMEKNNIKTSMEKNDIALEMNQLDLQKVLLEMRVFKHEYKNGKEITADEYKKITDKHEALVKKGDSLKEKNELLRKEVELCDKALQKFAEIDEKRVEGINAILRRDTVKPTKKKDEKVVEQKVADVKEQKVVDVKDQKNATIVEQKTSENKDIKNIEPKAVDVKEPKDAVVVEPKVSEDKEKKDTTPEVVGVQDAEVGKAKTEPTKFEGAKGVNSNALDGLAFGVKIEQPQENGTLENSDSEVIVDYMDKLWDITIDEKSDLLKVIDDKDNQNIMSIQSALEEKKSKFKRLGINQICKEIAGGKIAELRLRRKVNPAIIKAIETDKEMINRYIEAIYNEETLPFELTHDLTGLKLSEKLRVNKYAKAEEKTGATVLRKLFNKKKTLKESENNEVTKSEDLDFEIIEDFSSKTKSRDFKNKYKSEENENTIEDAKLEIAENVQEISSQEAKQEEFPRLDKLLNNSKLSETEKFVIAGYANMYGEKDAIEKYSKELAGAKVQLDVMNMIEERKQKEAEALLEKNGQNSPKGREETDEGLR